MTTEHKKQQKDETIVDAFAPTLFGLVIIALLGIGIYSAFIGVGEAFDFTNPAEGAPALVAAALAFGFLGLIMKPS